MVDEKKVKLMTRLSIYEKKEKNDGLVMSRFFERDYVRFNVLKTLVAATVVYWAVVGAYVFVSFEVILNSINNMDYFGVMYRILGWYAVFCFVYFFFAYLVYSYRYGKKRKGLTQYNSDLRDLIEISGGPMHRGKLVRNSNIDVIRDDDKNRKPSSERSRNVVNRTEMVRNRMKREEEERNKQIIENSRRLEEKRKNKQALMERKQRENEQAKFEMRQKRMALEEEQRRQNMQKSDTYMKGDNR